MLRARRWSATAGRTGPAADLRRTASSPSARLIAGCLSERRGSRSSCAWRSAATSGELVELAQRNAELALRQELLRASARDAPDRGAGGAARGAEPRGAADPHRVLRHLELRGGRTRGVDGRVRARASPKKSDYRIFGIGHGRRARTTSRRCPRPCARRFTRLPAGREDGYDRGFAALPNLVVIDGGKGQLSRGARCDGGLDLPRGAAIGARQARWRRSTCRVARPRSCSRRLAGLLLLQRIRDEAHRFALTHHRKRRGREATARRCSTRCPASARRRKQALLRALRHAAGVLDSHRRRARGRARAAGCRRRGRSTPTCTGGRRGGRGARPLRGPLRGRRPGARRGRLPGRCSDHTSRAEEVDRLGRAAAGSASSTARLARTSAASANVPDSTCTDAGVARHDAVRERRRERCAVPYGETVSYGELAERAGRVRPPARPATCAPAAPSRSSSLPSGDRADGSIGSRARRPPHKVRLLRWRACTCSGAARIVCLGGGTGLVDGPARAEGGRSGADGDRHAHRRRRLLRPPAPRARHPAARRHPGLPGGAGRGRVVHGQHLPAPLLRGASWPATTSATCSWRR